MWFRKLAGGPALPIGVSLIAGLLHLRALTQTPLLDYLTIDLEAYDRWARAIAAGDWLGSGVFYQDPLYPYAMALVYALFGADVTHVLVVQIAATALTIFLVHRLAGGLFGPQTAGVAAWSMALYQPAIFYAAKPEKACLSALGITALFWMLERVARARSPGRLFSAGIVLGLVALLRGNALLLVVPLAVLLLATDQLVTSRRRRALFALLAGTAAILLPVLLRNGLVGGDFVLTTSQAGANLFLGNHPGNHTGSYAPPGFVRPSPRYEEADFRRHAEAVTGRSLRPSEVSSFYLSQVAAWAWRDPAAFLRLQLLKARALVNAWEIPDNWSIDFVRRFSPLLNLPLLTFGIVFPFALLGAAVVIVRDRRALWLVVLGASYGATIVAFYVFSRYRYPILPVLVVLAAHGAVQFVALGRRHAWPAAAAATALLAVGAFAVHRPPTINPTADLSHRFFNLAASFFEDDRLDDAQALAQRAVEIDPGNGLALHTLARIAARRGDLAAEEEYLTRAQAARPFDDALLAQRVKMLVDRGDYRAAAAVLETAISRGAATAQTWQFLANVHFLSGDRAAARAALERGLALEPGNALLQRNLQALDAAARPEQP